MFKTQLSPGDSESGYSIGPTTTLPANSATQIGVSFANVPAGLTINLPLQILSDRGGIAQLVTSEGGTQPQSNGTPTVVGRLASVPASGSSLYNIIAADAAQTETFSIPIYISTVAGTVLTQSSIPTVTVELGPRTSQTTTAVPRFDSLATGNPTLFTLSDCGPISFNLTDELSSSIQILALSGPAGATFTAGTTSPYFTVGPSSGTFPSTIAIELVPGSPVSPGAYSGSIEVTSSAAGVSPSNIAVSYTVPFAPAATPAALAFGYAPASDGSGPFPAGQGITVSGAGSDLQVRAAPAWLAATVSANSVDVIAIPGGLAAGLYRGALQLTSSGQTTTVPISLAVSSQPKLSVSPDALSFAQFLEASGPAPVTIAVGASVDALPFSITADASWLTVSSTSGVTPAFPVVSFNTAGLAGGIYQATLTIAGPMPPAIEIPVTLQLAASLPGTGIFSVTSALSYSPTAFAQGRIISIFGTNLGPAIPGTLQLTGLGGVSTENAGTRVFANGVPCPILFTSAGQVNAVLPAELGISASLQVDYNGALSNPLVVPLLESGPELFTADGSGQGPAAALNADNSTNTASNPASAGTYVQLFGVGLTVPVLADGSIVPVSPLYPVLADSAVTVTIGGQSALVLFAGGAPDEVYGIDQMNVVIPSGLAPGLQPVTISEIGFTSQQSLGVYIK